MQAHTKVWWRGLALSRAKERALRIALSKAVTPTEREIVILYSEGHTPYSIARILNLGSKWRKLDHLAMKRVLMGCGVPLRSAAESHSAESEWRKRNGTAQSR